MKAALVFLLVCSLFNAVSGQDGKDSNCFPICRQGYICHNGECISMCNPPCPAGTECSKGVTCIPVQPDINPYGTNFGKIITGTTLSIIGVGLLTAGIIVYNKKQGGYYERVGQPMVIWGTVALMPGIPISILGFSMQKKSNDWEKKH